MNRISLVIADLDRDYLSKLERFLMVNYPQRFDIYSFSSHGKLAEFLNGPDKRNILLINSILFKRELNLENVELVILLKGDGMGNTPENMDSVSKYQHGELLVTDILRLYAARNHKCDVVQGRITTRTVCAHSPAGGTGKSNIAAGCSILCARKGLKTFYLNLEDIPSTSLFFSGSCTQSFSNVIYHLKGKAGSLGLKLEGAKCCDSETGVYFFAPPENILEMEELAPDDILRLISEIKATGLYDVIFIDMPAGLGQRNLSILKSSDVIMTILAAWDITVLKLGAMQKAQELLERKYGYGLAKKHVMVMNRCDRNYDYLDKPAISFKPDVEIQEIARSVKNGVQLGLTRDTAFLSGINRILDYVLRQDSGELSAYAGGGPGA